jgi:high-affinity iron transporter
MLASLVIVFREAIEAGLIVGIVLAATRGVPHRGRWVGYGVAAGTQGACLVAGFASELGALFNGSGQELFNAAVLLIAVGMLTWHNAWMAGHGRELAREVRAIGAAVAEGDRPLTALAVVVGVAVLREGSEVVLFLYGIFASGGTTIGAMLAGGAAGILLGAVMSALIYLGLLAVPAHRLFAVTTGLIMLLAAGLAAQAVFFLQQADYFPGLATPLWDTSWLLSDDSIPGRLMHTLIGYTATPDGAQLLAYAAVIALMLAMMRLVRGRMTHSRQPVRSSP